MELEKKLLLTHDETGAHAAEETPGAELAGDLDKTAGGGLTRESLGLVDLAQKSVSRLGDESSGETGEDTGAKVETGDGTGGELALVLAGSLDCVLENDLVHGELGHGVRNLLEQDRTEAVQRSKWAPWSGSILAKPNVTFWR